jgi:hypothetical protein
MFQKLFSLFILFIASNSALSQTFSQNRGAVEDRLLSEKNNDSLVIDSKTNLQIQKKAFDSNLKVSPEVFYIVNDKPASREEYLKHSKKEQ